MEAHSDWYNRTDKEIGLHRDNLSNKDYKKYKLDLLLRIARRVEDFSSICGECQLFQQEITKLTQDLGYLLQMPNPSIGDFVETEVKNLEILQPFQRDKPAVGNCGAVEGQAFQTCQSF